MIDVNIVAADNVAALLAFECERFELKYKISDIPISNTALFIIDIELYNAPLPSPEKTIIIGAKKTSLTSRCLEKPFLISDLRQILRNMIMLNATSQKMPTVQRKSNVGKLSLNAEERSVTIRKNKVILSPTEYKIFEALALRKKEILTYEEIDKLIGGNGTNKANVYICLLRKKLEANGDKIIYSVRGKGFTIK